MYQSFYLVGLLSDSHKDFISSVYVHARVCQIEGNVHVQ